VVEAITRVIRDLPSIGRNERAPDDQGGYTFRGIEQITAHVAPLLARHGVVFVPAVEAVETRSVCAAQALWTDTILTVRYRIYGPGGRDDCVEAVVVGIGRDNSDKGANKALTQAFKYALIEVLCIADAKHDADGVILQTEASSRATHDAIEDLMERIRALPPELASSFKTWKDAQRFRWPWSDTDVDTMHRKLDETS
jgi:hypothetical protein